MDFLYQILPSIFWHPWIFIPVFALCVFFATFLGFPIVYKKLEKRFVASKTEIKRYLDLMFSEVEDKKLTLLLILVSYGVGFVFFLLFFPNVIGGLIFGSVVVFIGSFIPLKYIESRYHKRCQRVVDQMVDGMTIMANGVKVGLSVTQAMERVVDNIKGPLSQEFSMVLNKVRLGMTVEEALNEMADRVPMADLQMFVTAVNILKETGGNMGETFETINITVRERQKVEKKIQALTAQGSMQGIIISCVPFALLAMFWIMDPDFVRPLFTTTMGLIALFIVMVLVAIGGVVIKKVITIKV